MYIEPFQNGGEILLLDIDAFLDDYVRTQCLNEQQQFIKYINEDEDQVRTR